MTAEVPHQRRALMLIVNLQRIYKRLSEIRLRLTNFIGLSLLDSLETSTNLIEIQSSTFFEQIGNLTLKIMILIGTDLDQIGYHEQSMLFCYRNGNHTLSAHKLFFF